MIVKNEKLLATFRGPGQCEMCGKSGFKVPHHIKPKGHGGGSRLDIRINLISLLDDFDCSCHSDWHDGRGKDWEKGKPGFLAVVAAREDCLQGEITECINLLLRLPKDATTERVKRELVGWNDGERRLWALVWDEITGVRS
jgi:hypothetical protein